MCPRRTDIMIKALEEEENKLKDEIINTGSGIYTGKMIYVLCKTLIKLFAEK